MPTARGWAVGAGTAGCFLVSWWLGYVEFAMLGTAGLAALVLARLVLARRVPLRVNRDVAPSRCGRGDAALGVVTITNLGRFTTPPLAATDWCGTPLSVRIPPLAPSAEHTASYFLPTGRRGEIPVGPLRLAAFDPLGLFRRVHSYGQQTTLLVHPRTVPLSTPPSGRTSNVDGPTSETAPSGTVTFHALREYVFGDDLRHIHWRTSARTGTLMVRHLVDSSLPRSTVLLDNRAGGYPDGDRFESAVDIAASLALAATTKGFPLTLVTADGPALSTAAGRGTTGPLLKHLALLGTGGPTSLATMVAGVRSHAAGGWLAVVTGEADPDELATLASVRTRFDRAVLVRVGVDLPPLPASFPLPTVVVPDIDGFAAAWRRTSNPRAAR